MFINEGVWNSVILEKGSPWLSKGLFPAVAKYALKPEATSKGTGVALVCVKVLRHGWHELVLTRKAKSVNVVSGAGTESFPANEYSARVYLQRSHSVIEVEYIDGSTDSLFVELKAFDKIVEDSMVIEVPAQYTVGGEQLRIPANIFRYHNPCNTLHINPREGCHINVRLKSNSKADWKVHVTVENGQTKSSLFQVNNASEIKLDTLKPESDTYLTKEAVYEVQAVSEGGVFNCSIPVSYAKGVAELAHLEYNVYPVNRSHILLGVSKHQAKFIHGIEGMVPVTESIGRGEYLYYGRIKPSYIVTDVYGFNREVALKFEALDKDVLLEPVIAIPSKTGGSKILSDNIDTSKQYVGQLKTYNGSSEYVFERTLGSLDVPVTAPSGLTRIASFDTDPQVKETVGYGIAYPDGGFARDVVVPYAVTVAPITTAASVKVGAHYITELTRGKHPLNSPVPQAVYYKPTAFDNLEQVTSWYITEPDGKSYYKGSTQEDIPELSEDGDVSIFGEDLNGLVFLKIKKPSSEDGKVETPVKEVPFEVPTLINVTSEEEGKCAVRLGLASVFNVTDGNKHLRVESVDVGLSLIHARTNGVFAVNTHNGETLYSPSKELLLPEGSWIVRFSQAGVLLSASVEVTSNQAAVEMGGYGYLRLKEGFQNCYAWEAPLNTSLSVGEGTQIYMQGHPSSEVQLTAENNNRFVRVVRNLDGKTIGSFFVHLLEEKDVPTIKAGLNGITVTSPSKVDTINITDLEGSRSATGKFYVDSGTNKAEVSIGTRTYDLKHFTSGFDYNPLYVLEGGTLSVDGSMGLHNYGISTADGQVRWFAASEESALTFEDLEASNARSLLLRYREGDTYIIHEREIFRIKNEEIPLSIRISQYDINGVEIPVNGLPLEMNARVLFKVKSTNTGVRLSLDEFTPWSSLPSSVIKEGYAEALLNTFFNGTPIVIYAVTPWKKCKVTLHPDSSIFLSME